MISQTTPAGVQPREPREVDGRLGLAGALEHAARRARSGKTCPGWTRSCGPLRRVDRDLDRARAVVRGDAGGDALARLDRDGERRAERRLVARRVIGRKPSSSQRSSRQAEADEAAAVRGHEVDRLGRRELRGDRQVALVLAVGVVDDDDELALRGCPRSPPRSCANGGLLVARLAGHAVGNRHVGASRRAASRRSTYFASTSTSRLTSSPGASAAERRRRERVRDERDRERVRRRARRS